jgi:hypothetical protein
MLTNKQHILHELEKNDPLNLKNLLIALREKKIEITAIELHKGLDRLIDDTWVEYYGLTDMTLGYVLSNHWYNLEESERNKILTGE